MKIKFLTLLTSPHGVFFILYKTATTLLNIFALTKKEKLKKKKARVTNRRNKSCQLKLLTWSITLWDTVQLSQT